MKRLFVILCFSAAAFADQPEALHTQLFRASVRPLAKEINRPSINLQPLDASPQNNVGKAFIMSLILPGWGQRYVGAKTKSELFFGAETGLWLTYAGFTAFSKWREQDYRTYAAENAGVNLDGKSSSYFIDVGNFNSIYEHNAYRLQQRNTAKYYFDEEAYFWQWQSAEHRARFDRLRVSSDTARNRATFTLGAIVANHVFSAIDAVWSARRANRGQASETSWNLRFGDGWVQPTVHVAIERHF